MKKQGKKWMLVVLALLAVVTVTLPLVGCKNDSVSEQTGGNAEQPATPGTDDQGTGDQGSGDPGTDDPGTGDQGSGDPGTDDPGTDDPGTDDPGTGDQGSGDQGSGDQGSGDQGSGDQGSGDQEQPVTYTVSFNTNGGGSIDSQTIVSGQTATKPAADPSLENNVFGGWYSDEALTETYNFNTPVKETITLYAKWTLEDSVKPGMVEVTGAIVTGSGDQGVFIKGRTVKLSAFEIGKYEVTQELYKAVMTGQTVTDRLGKEHTLRANPSEFIDNPATDETQKKRPVEWVNWYEAVCFCNELTKKTMSAEACVYTITGITVINGSINSATVEADFTKKGYRLPTEAEWEYAARGGDQSNTTEWNYTYAGDNNKANVAWYYANSDDKTHEVGKKNPNSLGIYDMSGNVYEWCWDRDAGINADTPITGSTWEGATRRINRGGCWSYAETHCSVSYRLGNYPVSRDSRIGFRVVRGL